MSSMTLKWGTMKQWDFEDTPAAHTLLKEYGELGSSFSAMAQKDTPRQKEIICELIDLCNGDIWLDWDGELVSKERAKQYINDYGKDND